MAPTGGPGEGISVGVTVTLVVVEAEVAVLVVDRSVGVVVLQVASQPLGVGERVWMPRTTLFPQMNKVL